MIPSPVDRSPAHWLMANVTPELTALVLSIIVIALLVWRFS